MPSTKIFWKNSAHFFAEGHAWRPSAKIFQKKKSLPRAPGDSPRQRLRPRRRCRDDCFSLPSAAPALGKGFAECPIKGPRQRPLRRLKIPRGVFAEGSPRQSLCRGFLVLCRGPEALGKACASSSVGGSGRSPEPPGSVLLLRVPTILQFTMTQLVPLS